MSSKWTAYLLKNVWNAFCFLTNNSHKNKQTSFMFVCFFFSQCLILGPSRFSKTRYTFHTELLSSRNCLKFEMSKAKRLIKTKKINIYIYTLWVIFIHVYPVYPVYYCLKHWISSNVWMCFATVDTGDRRGQHCNNNKYECAQPQSPK